MKKIINWVKHINWGGKLNCFHYINCFLLLIAFTLPFLAGSYSADAKFEELANYTANRVADSTISGEILAVSVSETESSGPLPGSDDEFLKTYGTFKQTTPDFCSGYNLDKKGSVYIEDLNDNNNLSIIYTGADTSIEYNNHYKHGTYPFELMFSTPRLYDISRYMIYISQTQANAFLELKNIQKTGEEYLESDYEGLIKQTFEMKVDGAIHTCVICNIFYEHNYYYNSVKEVTGDCVLCAYYNPTPYPRENIYFFRNKTYQTLYYMKYIIDSYPDKDYCVQLLDTNLTQEIDTQRILSFYYATFATNGVIFSFVILGILIVSFVCVLNFIKLWNLNLKYILLEGFSFFITYIIFFIVSLINESTLFFSDFGIKLFIYLLFYYAITMFVLFVVNKFYEKHTKKRAWNHL